MGKAFRAKISGLALVCFASITCAQQVKNKAVVSAADTAKVSVFHQAIVPGTLITYGLISLNNKSLQQFDRYVQGSVLNKQSFSNIDDYLRYAPIGAVYGLNAIGVEGKNRFVDRTILFFISTTIASAGVTLLKDGTQRLRPDASNRHSFPSGHTAMAFMSAELMHQEYKHQSIWFSVAGFAAASATGTIRLFRHAHWFSDVVMGAGYGILSTKLAYFIYPFLKNLIRPHPNQSLSIIPFRQQQQTGIWMQYAF